MVEAEKPDIVSVTTQATLHAEVTIFAAEHGLKAVYCEKAMACSLQEAVAMAEACRRNDTQFNIGTLRRYHPGYGKMREIAQSGEIGHPRTAVFYGGGALLHMASHSIDTLCYLLGDPEPELVQGRLGVSAEAISADTLDSDPALLSFCIRFRNGAEAYGVPAPGLHEYELHCTGGVLRAMNNGVHWSLRKPTSPQAEMGRREALWNPAEFPDFEKKSPTVRCIEDLIDSIETGRPSQGNVQIAKKVMEISMGIAESHRLGSVPVSLPVDDRKLYIASR